MGVAAVVLLRQRMEHTVGDGEYRAAETDMDAESSVSAGVENPFANGVGLAGDITVANVREGGGIAMVSEGGALHRPYCPGTNVVFESEIVTISNLLSKWIFPSSCSAKIMIKIIEGRGRWGIALPRK